MNIKQWATDDRPRERMILHGATALSNAELLAILWEKGYNILGFEEKPQRI